MVKVKKYVGVYSHTAKDGTKTFHIRGKINGKNYTEVIGSTKEGITAQFASNMRAKKHGIIKLGEDSPMHTVTVYTLDEASDLYFHSIKHKSNTPNAKSVYAKHIAVPFGSRTLEDITPHDIDLLKTNKLDEKIVRIMPNGKLKPLDRTYSKASVNKIIDLVSVIYSYMNKKHGTDVKNPCKGIERYKVDNKRERWLETEEIAELLNEIRTNPKLRKREMVELFVLLALSTGARMAGIMNIAKVDVDLKNNNIIVKDFKRNMTYDCTIHDDVKPLLEAKMKQIKPIDFVISGTPKQMHKDSMAKMLQPILNKLFNEGLDKTDSKRRTVIHTFRHTFASLLVKDGTPIFTVKKLLNHKEIDMTMRYAKLAPKEGAENVNKLKFR